MSIEAPNSGLLLRSVVKGNFHAKFWRPTGGVIHSLSLITVLDKRFSEDIEIVRKQYSAACRRTDYSDRRTALVMNMVLLKGLELSVVYMLILKRYIFG